ncbi:MAG: hypothetical protein CMJ31_05025 [Phycisphaerae bacterium]|nr:hypothetical protein [Phycisphaerae bacterium]
MTIGAAWFRAFLSFACLVFVVGVPGCGSGGGDDSQRVLHADPLRSELAPSDGREGVRLLTWSTNADSSRLAVALHRYMDAESLLEPIVVDRWRQAGFRVMTAPLVEVESVRRTVGARGASQQRWLGQPAAWTPLIEGLASAGSVTDGAATVALRGASPRLIGRGWEAARPVSGNGAAEAEFWLELVPQLRDAVDPFAIVGLDPAGRGGGNTALGDGLVFRRLLLRTALPRGMALIVVPEEPGADWASILDAGSGVMEASIGSNADVAGPSSDGVRVSGAASGSVAASPWDGGAALPSPVVGVPLGLQTLTTDAAGAVTGKSPRAVVVIAPSLAERFTLLGAAPR